MGQGKTGSVQNGINMIELGKIQELKLVKRVEFGAYLSDHLNEKESSNRVLLPLKQVPATAGVGDSIEVFIYKDSEDRLISTVKKPALTLGEVALLTVNEVGNIGAFLDWGLEKELLLPFKEQTKRVQQGDQCLVALYIDKSSRLCATMKVYEYLQTDSSYKADDKVTGMVYEISNDFGAFVAVDNKYSGLIATKELYGTVFVGQQITARVTAVKPDGKLDLSIREKAYLQIEKDALKIIEVMEAGGGELPFNDKASPELIKEKVSMSKNEFKRAVGSLLKAGRIVITDTAIKLIK